MIQRLSAILIFYTVSLFSCGNSSDKKSSQNEMNTEDKNTQQIEVGEAEGSTGEWYKNFPPTQLALGDYHTCAIKNQKIYCWGHGNFGALGNGDTKNIGTTRFPTGLKPLPFTEKPVQIAAGGLTTCALFANKRIRCWGANSYGAAGQPGENLYGDKPGTSAEKLAFLQLDPAIEISIGSSHGCAKLESGKVSCWGKGACGSLGTESRENIGDDESLSESVAVMLEGPTKSLATSNATTCALQSDGKIFCWGSSLSCDANQPIAKPKEFIGNSVAGGMKSLFFNQQFVCGVNSEDAFICEKTGANFPVMGGADFLGLKAMSGNRSTICSLSVTGIVRCWGKNKNGTLGLPSISETPSTLTFGQLPALEIGHKVTSIQSAEEHTCVVTETEEILCWGNGSLGRLGYGNENNIGDDEKPASAGIIKFSIE